MLGSKTNIIDYIKIIYENIIDYKDWHIKSNGKIYIYNKS